MVLGEETCISDWECGDPSNEAVKPWVKLSPAITWEAEHRLIVYLLCVPTHWVLEASFDNALQKDKMRKKLVSL